MTVGIAALAARSKAIVLVSDKALSLETSEGSLHGDTDLQKIVPFGKTGWFVLFSGGIVNCGAIIERSLERFNGLPKAERTSGKIVSSFETSLSAYRDSLIESQILAPYLLTKELWSERPAKLIPLAESVVTEIQNDLNKFKLGCEFLLCGFDDNGDPQIFCFDEHRGRRSLTSQGIGVIGEGATDALERILLQEWQTKDSVEEVLYAAYDAKAHSESSAGAVYSWDARVVVRGWSGAVPSRVQRLIESVFVDTTRSPFKKKDEVPTDWRESLQAYGGGVLEKAKKRGK